MAVSSILRRGGIFKKLQKSPISILRDRTEKMVGEVVQQLAQSTTVTKNRVMMVSSSLEIKKKLFKIQDKLQNLSKNCGFDINQQNQPSPTNNLYNRRTKHKSANKSIIPPLTVLVDNLKPNEPKSPFVFKKYKDSDDMIQTPSFIDNSKHNVSRSPYTMSQFSLNKSINNNSADSPQNEFAKFSLAFNKHTKIQCIKESETSITSDN